MGSLASGLLSTVRKASRRLARPADAVSGEGGIVLRPYRGYGTPKEVFLIGRVYRQPPLSPGERQRGDLARTLAEIARLLRRRGIADVGIVARLDGAEQRTRTDRDGYFRIHLRPETPPPDGRLWRRMAIELEGQVRLRAEAELFIAPASARVVVISDIDDTVMETGVANKAVMLWRLFGQAAERRTAFPGVAAFLRALYRGPSGTEANPMLYVSRAPWGIYEVLDEFFRRHDIPIGPLLFLREWGMTLQSPLPRRAKDHKLDLIRHMLDLYADLPFVLIGDSGQEDPELYARIVREHPGRVRAVYIRNVSRSEARMAEIERLAGEVAAAGSTLLLAADSLAMAEHAERHGLIDGASMAEMRRQRPQAASAVAEPTTVAPQEIAQALDRADRQEPAPSVEVEGQRLKAAPGSDRPPTPP